MLEIKEKIQEPLIDLIDYELEVISRYDSSLDPMLHDIALALQKLVIKYNIK